MALGVGTEITSPASDYSPAVHFHRCALGDHDTMKLFPTHRKRRHGQRGFLVIALLAIITIMLVYIAANLHVLAALKRDIQLVEQKQVQRLSKSFPYTATNGAPSVATVDNPDP